MQDITVTITAQKIQEAFDKSATEIFKSDYSNPVRTLMDAAIKENSGAIKKVVDEIIADAVSSPEFKSRIADAVIANMVKSAMK